MTTKREPMLSMDDLSVELAVPLSTVKRWRKHHIGPVGIRVGKVVRYRRRDVDAWLNDNADRRAS